MPTMHAALHAFNRGIVGATALARIDLERMRLSAEEQTNWMPRSLGAMTLRPGMQFLQSTRDNLKARMLPFVYSTTDMALLECTVGTLRPLVNDQTVYRVATSTTVTNGDFSSATGWTITTTAGATGSITGGKLLMACVAIDSYVTCARTVSVAGGDLNKEHAFRIVVDRGPVYFRAGSVSGGEDYIGTILLETGTHSLAMYPAAGTVYIEFESRDARQIIVDSVQIEGEGVLTLPAFWTEADLPYLRSEQSGFVVYLACAGYRRYKILRPIPRSWSIVIYEEVDGPFLGYTTEASIKMRIDQARGNATLTASRPFFRSTHLGALFRMLTPGYDFTYNLGQADCFTPAVRVNGVGASRSVGIVVTGTWAGTLTVQRSFTAEDSGFTDITSSPSPITANSTVNFTDTADNTAIWVRVGFKAGEYTSGLATVQVVFGAGGSGGGTSSAVTSVGGRTGVCRVLSVAAGGLSCSVEILEPFSSTQTTVDWFEGEWSARRGWPSAVALHEGRLFWASRDKVVGSVPDAYNSYDPSVEGDSGPIQRSIGFGPVQVVNWLLSLTRLMIGGESNEIAVRSSSFDEPLTPTNFSLKDISTYGSARLPSVKVDRRGIFVDKSGLQLMGIEFSLEANDYDTTTLSQIVPDINVDNPIVGIAVQRQPDTRIHCWRQDGTVLVLVFEPKEDVKCFVEVETDGVVEDVVVLPGQNEDAVYYVVKRTFGSQVNRYIEKWAQENQCVGGTLNRQADSFVIYQGAGTPVLTGLSHLEGEEVVVWADGIDRSPMLPDGTQKTYTVTGGSISLAEPWVENAVIGLPYAARFKSAKLAYAAAMGTALGQTKKINNVSLVMHKTHHLGVRHGYDFDHLESLPLIIDEQEISPDTIHEHYDHKMNPQRGVWTTDARLCLEARAPRPVTVLGAVIGITTHDHS